MNYEENKSTDNSIWKSLLKEKIASIKQEDNQNDNPEEIFNEICDYLNTKISKEQYEYNQSVFNYPNGDQYTFELKIHCPQDHYFGIKDTVYYGKDKKCDFDASPFKIYHTTKHLSYWHMIQMNISLKNIKEVLNGILDIINNFDSYLITSNKEDEEREKYLEKKRDSEKQINELLSLKFRGHKYNNTSLSIYTNDDLLLSLNKETTIIRDSTDIDNIEIKLPAFSAILALHPEIDAIEFERKNEETND